MNLKWKYETLGEECTVKEVWSNGTVRMTRECLMGDNLENYAVVVDIYEYLSDFDKTELTYINRFSYEYLSKTALQGGEIIMCNTGQPIGMCFICPRVAYRMTLGHYSLMINTPNNAFYIYYFKSEHFREQLATIINRKTTPVFSRAALLKLEIPILSPKKQKYIATRLDSAFAGIDNLRANAKKQISAACDMLPTAYSRVMEPKKDWKKRKLKDIATVGRGKTKKELLAENGTYPVYGTSSNGFLGDTQISGYSNEYLFEAGVTLLGRKGCLNKPVYVNERCCVLDSAFGITPKEGIDNRFLYYLIRGVNWFQKRNVAQLPTIAQRRIENVYFYVPSLSEQQRIASRLDAVSAHSKALEEVNRKIVSECDALEKALLKRVFG